MPLPPTVKKLRTLAQIAARLQEGEDFPVTRLTTLKGFCEDPEAAAKFALHLAKQAQNKVEHQRWADVRIVECWDLLIVETAMECVLRPYASSIIGYHFSTGECQAFPPIRQQHPEGQSRHAAPEEGNEQRKADGEGTPLRRCPSQNCPD
jgi:hypothetical protein